MVEGGYSTGHLRRKYLDMANMSFAQSKYITSKQYILSFVDTVKEGSKASDEIKAEFDKAVKIKNDRIDEIKKEASTLGYLERNDFEKDAKMEAEVNAVHDMKEICWCIADRNGLFND